MSTASAYLTVRGIDVDVVYKDIKNLHIGVYPPMGRVRVAAPQAARRGTGPPGGHPAAAVDQAAAPALQDAERQSEREMVTGESHYVWGVRHRLKVIERPGRAHVEVDGDRLLMYVPEARHRRASRAARPLAPRAAPRRHPGLIAKWEPIIDSVSTLEHPTHEDQVGLVQPRDRSHLVQPRTRQEAPWTAWSTSSSTR